MENDATYGKVNSCEQEIFDILQDVHDADEEVASDDCSTELCQRSPRSDGHLHYGDFLSCAQTEKFSV